MGVKELVIEARSAAVKWCSTLERRLLGAMDDEEEAIGVGSDDGA